MTNRTPPDWACEKKGNSYGYGYGNSYGDGSGDGYGYGTGYGEPEEIEKTDDE